MVLNPSSQPIKKLLIRTLVGFYFILIMVPVEGLEPSRVLPHRILSPTRLPIPPHWQVMQNNNIKLLALLQDIIIHFLNHYHYSSLDTLT